MAHTRILLVDDEPPLLELIERYLKRQGLDVEPQSSALAALKRIQESPEPYDMVIADLGLPDMPGDAMVLEMLRAKPDLLGLICSGSEYFISSVPEPLRPRVAFLQKPFLPKELAAKVQQLLAQRDGTPQP